MNRTSATRGRAGLGGCGNAGKRLEVKYEFDIRNFYLQDWICYDAYLSITTQLYQQQVLGMVALFAQV